MLRKKGLLVEANRFLAERANHELAIGHHICKGKMLKLTDFAVKTSQERLHFYSYLFCQI